MFAYAQDIGWIYGGGPPHLVPAGWNPPGVWYIWGMGRRVYKRVVVVERAVLVFFWDV